MFARHQIVSEHDGAGIMQSLAVMMKEIDFPFGLAVQFEFEDPGVGTGEDISPDG